MLNYKFNPTGSKGNMWFGYFKENSLYDGRIYQNGILTKNIINGVFKHAIRCDKIPRKSSFHHCPDGQKFKPINGGYVDNDGLMQNKFKIIFGDGSIYDGNMKDNKMDGYGYLIWSNVETHKGYWQQGRQNGIGKYTLPDGSSYESSWKNGAQDGEITYNDKNGNKEKGIWKDGKFMYAKKPTPTSNSKLDRYKSFYSEIGFTPGTEKFGECVVEAMKKG